MATYAGRTKNWRATQVKERLAELSGQQYSEGMLWRMAEQRVAERQRRKPEYHKIVEAEYQRLLKEAEQALREEYELVSPA
jgi:hypothetical protein